MFRRIVRSPALLAMAALAAFAGFLAAHDLFLKPSHFFVTPNSAVTVHVLNGTFSKSENSITRDRLLDVSLQGPHGRSRIDTTEWDASGDTSRLVIRVGDAGTYALGASTRARSLEMSGKDFNEYLEADGIPDALAERRAKGELGRAVRERYHKHVKAIVQAGDRRSDHYGAEFGYPAEIIPLENPYDVKAGGTLRVRLLANGRPAANQVVIAGGRTPSGGRIPMAGVRSDADGVARIAIRSRGTWYVKFIHMTRLDGDAEVDYESRWASLTFAVR